MVPRPGNIDPLFSRLLPARFETLPVVPVGPAEPGLPLSTAVAARAPLRHYAEAPPPPPAAARQPSSTSATASASPASPATASAASASAPSVAAPPSLGYSEALVSAAATFTGRGRIDAIDLDVWRSAERALGPLEEGEGSQKERLEAFLLHELEYCYGQGQVSYAVSTYQAYLTSLRINIQLHLCAGGCCQPGMGPDGAREPAGGV